MVRITIDDDLKQKLLAEAGEVELCDREGNVIRRAAPLAWSPPPGWVPLNPIPTEEELRQRAEYDGPGITTDELIQRLRSRP